MQNTSIFYGILWSVIVIRLSRLKLSFNSAPQQRLPLWHFFWFVANFNGCPFLFVFVFFLIFKASSIDRQTSCGPIYELWLWQAFWVLIASLPLSLSYLLHLCLSRSLSLALCLSRRDILTCILSIKTAAAVCHLIWFWWRSPSISAYKVTERFHSNLAFNTEKYRMMCPPSLCEIDL